MDFYEKLWYYCPRPIKHRTRLITRLATILHIPNLRLRKPKVPVFGLLSLTMSTALYILGTYVFVGLTTGNLGGITILAENPVLLTLSFFVFFFLWISIDWFLEQTRKNRSKPLFVALFLLILLPTLFSGALASRLFDSISLSRGSRIDLYNGTIDLFMSNTGIVDVHVTSIEVGNLTFGFDFMLRRGETERLSIRYTETNTPGTATQALETSTIQKCLCLICLWRFPRPLSRRANARYSSTQTDYSLVDMKYPRDSRETKMSVASWLM